jgi:sialate O-acetylesterase
MIESWRTLFQVPNAFFGYIELSTWCVNGSSVAELRDAQYNALPLGGVGYAVNADHGAGCNIHPPPKQYCSKRLANSALALQYGQQLDWKSPSYAGAAASGTSSATIRLNDVGTNGLQLIDTPFNAGTLNCSDPKISASCAGVSLGYDTGAWVDASVSLTADKQGLILTPASVPSGATRIVASSYNWGSVPIAMRAYASGDRPVRQWNATIA